LDRRKFINEITNLIVDNSKELQEENKLRIYIKNMLKEYMVAFDFVNSSSNGVSMGYSRAYKELKKINREVADFKQTDYYTVNTFIKNIFHQGLSGISVQEFVEYLESKGIKVIRTRKNKRYKMQPK